MAKERLSKLQKWILEQTYKLNILHDGSVVGHKSAYYYKSGSSEMKYQYFECWIYEKYYGFRRNGISSTLAYNKAHVTVYRAVWNMIEKGLIEAYRYVGYQNMGHWSITDKGIELLKKCCPDLFTVS